MMEDLWSQPWIERYEIIEAVWSRKENDYCSRDSLTDLKINPTESSFPSSVLCFSRSVFFFFFFLPSERRD